MPPREIMDPPFFTSRQAVGFALLLAAFLVLPLALGRSGLTHQDLYPGVPDKWGGFSYIYRQIFEERSEIDVLILATSFVYQGIDAPYIEEELSRRLGRKANVVTFATNWRCEALNYALVRDVLQRRRVRLLLFSMPAYFQVETLPHVQSFRWSLYDQDYAALDGLPARYRTTFHAETVLGAPRQLLSLLRPDEVDDRVWAAGRGTLKMDLGIYPAPFVRFTPPPPRLPAEKLVYSPRTNPSYRFTGEGLTPYQLHYLRLLFELIGKHRVPVALVHMPLWTERHDSLVTERMNWPDVFGTDMTQIGVPPATLFRGLKDEEIDRLYFIVENAPPHYLHLNRNGSEYFTRVITPAIVGTYVQQTGIRQ